MIVVILIAFDFQYFFLRYFWQHVFVKHWQIVDVVLQSIETIMHAWSASAWCQSALFKPKIFSYRIVVLQ